MSILAASSLTCEAGDRLDEATSTASSPVEASELISARVTLPAGCSDVPFGGLALHDFDPYETSRAIAVVPGVVVGLPSSASLLAIDCPVNQLTQASQIKLIDPLTDAVVRTLDLEANTPAGVGGNWVAFAFRADRGDLIGLQAVQNVSATYRVHRIELGDVASGTSRVTQLFEVPPLGTDVAVGLAWDATENLAKVVLRVPPPNPAFPNPKARIDRYDEDGFFVGDTLVEFTGNENFAIFSRAAGLLSSGGVEILARNQITTDVPNTNIRLLDVDPIFGTVDAPTPLPGLIVVDIECDTLTFAAQEKTVIWGISRLGDFAHAFEVPRETCELGGAEAFPKQNFLDPANPTQPNPFFQLSCSSLQTDVDFDGILDCWEVAGFIDWDFNLLPDYIWPLAIKPVVGVQDVYLEIDYMQGKQPPAADVQAVQQAFQNAPTLASPFWPLPIPRKLHVQVDDQVTFAAEIAWENCTAPSSGASVPDFLELKVQFFGTATERSLTLPYLDNPTLAAKASVFRYAIWANLLLGKGLTSGCGELGGNDFLVTVGITSLADPNQYRRGTLMHELGHTLNLAHGGGDSINYKPNYLSVVNYTFQHRTWVGSRPLDYSRAKLTTLTEASLLEQLGLQGPSGQTSRFFPNCTNPNVCAGATNISTSGGVDWDKSGSVGGLVAVSLNANTVLEVLNGQNDWAQLSVPFANPAATLDGVNVFIVPEDDPMPSLADDSDGDGVPALTDNCPVLSNPQQEDSNADGLGDACDPIPRVDCVLARGGGQFSAFFGYDNPIFDPRSIAIGPENQFAPAPADRGQPTTFDVGLHRRAFSVDFDGSDLTWTLGFRSVTASNASPACSGIELTLLDFASDVVLFADDSLELGSHVALTGVAGPPAIANAGSALTLVGSHAGIGNVWSESTVSVGSHATVDGFIRTASSASIGKHATVTGGVFEHVPVDLPHLAWQLPFPAAGSNILVPAHGSRSATPGSYGSVLVQPHGVLALASGIYFFDSLEVKPHAELHLDSSAGPVIVYVEASLQCAGSISDVAAPNPNLLVGYFGMQTATLRPPFGGTLIAPNATLSMGGPMAAAYSGVFFARALAVGAGAEMRFVPLDPEDF